MALRNFLIVYLAATGRPDPAEGNKKWWTITVHHFSFTYA
jgi:hypothetical protein